MEAIRNYLETMFQNMPNTEQVRKAKYELGQMMEDKYTELKNEGKTENEAVGTVISEFGNLDELAQDLGISNVVNSNNYSEEKQVTLKEVKEYISAKSKAGFMIGLGVLMCIISPSMLVLGGYMNLNEAFGLLFLFTMIGLAVGLFVFSGLLMDKWAYLQKLPCSIDFATAEYVHNEKENYRMTGALQLTVGIMLCVVCFVPLVVMESFFGRGLFEGVGVVILFVMVGLGVCFIITSSVRNEAYKEVLKVNKAGTMGAAFVLSQKEKKYTNKTVEAIMSVYWPTVTCIYLCWSFLTMNWHITWVVWVIAGLIETFVKNLFTESI